MAENSLSVFVNDAGLELVIDTATGEAFATQAGYARMSGITKQAISKRVLNPVNCVNLKTSEVLTTQGLRTVNLIPADTVFAWLLKDNIDLAMAMGKVGATVYLHQLAGYEVKSTAVAPQPQTPQTYLEALKALVASEEEKQRLQQDNELLAEENRLLEETNQKLAEITDELFNYSSIIRVSKFNNISEKNFSWHRLKAASNRLKLEVKQVPCSRFTYKNLYHHDAWRLAYPDAKLPETTTLVIKAA